MVVWLGKRKGGKEGRGKGSTGARAQRLGMDAGHESAVRLLPTGRLVLTNPTLQSDLSLCKE